MRRVAIFSTALLTLAAWQAWGAEGAASPNVDQLISEFTGAAGAPNSAPQRTDEQLKADLNAVLDSLLPAMGGAALKSQEPAQQTFQRICLRAGRPGATRERTALCLAICAKLGPGTAKPARVWMLRQLEQIGGDESVGTLAQLLADPDAEVRESARRALQANPSDDASNALSTALDLIPPPGGPEWQVAIINALGQREVAARRLGQFKVLLADENDDVAAAAAAAMSKDPQAGPMIAAKLKDATGKRLALLQVAYVECADRQLSAGSPVDAEVLRKIHMTGQSKAIRLAAVRCLGRADVDKALPLLTDCLKTGEPQTKAVVAQLLADAPGQKFTLALTELLKDGEPADHVLCLRILADRGDRLALPAIGRVLDSKDEAVRVAALAALGALGDAAAAPILAGRAATAVGKERDAARSGLARLKGADVDAAILAALAKSPPPVRRELVLALSARRGGQPAVTATLVALAGKDEDESVRSAAWDAIGVLTPDAGNWPDLIALFAKIDSAAVRLSAEKALLAIAGRAADRNGLAKPVLEQSTGSPEATRVSLLKVLGRIGSADALAAVVAATTDANANVSEAAFGALWEWQDPSAAGTFFDMARKSADDVHRVMALRAYVRMVAMPSSRPPARTVKMLADGLDLARRPDEKKMILAKLGEIKDVAALKLAAPLLADDNVRAEAAVAVLKIAAAVGKDSPAETRAALEQVVGATKDPNVVRQAKSLLDKLPRPARPTSRPTP